MRPLVVLRPEPGAGRTAERARAMGFRVFSRPLFEAEAIGWSARPATDYDAVLLTSAQAARLAGPALAAYAALPAYAVGAATAAALKEQGFADVVSGDGDGAAIAARIEADGLTHVLHLSGTAVAMHPPGGLHVDVVPVYTMVVRDELVLPPLAGATVLVHSPRTGARLAALAPPRARQGAHLVAISPAALAACGDGWASAQAAARPNDDEMLALAARLCD